MAKLSCDDAVLKGSVPLAHLEDIGKYPNGSKPRLGGEDSPETFYRSLVALVLATLRFGEMSRVGFIRRENLAAI